MKRVAVVGAGIAGIVAAERLAQRHAVTLIEADDRLGGHTDTHAIAVDERVCRVDSGFIVFNRLNYPGFSAWLDQLGVASQPSDMSFGVSSARGGVEYGTRDLRALFADPVNLVRPRFIGMLRDLARFYREARTLAPNDARLTLGEYLDLRGYDEPFARYHLVPMCAALWSAPVAAARDLPMRHVVTFMARHRMLEVSGRPEWRVVCDGSATYVEAFRKRFHGRILTGAPVRAIARSANGVRLQLAHGELSFDAVFLACHSDQALRLLQQPTAAERAVLGAIGYRKNRVVVHSDTRLMPRRRSAWSSWNVVEPPGADRYCVTYWMNRLQSLAVSRPVLVTVEPSIQISDALVHCEREYAHPEFTHGAMEAQHAKPQLDGRLHTYYCGAYWGAGFHEDGFVSAVDACAAFDAKEVTNRAA